MKKFRKFFSLNRSDRLLLFKVVFLLGTIRLALKLLPFGQLRGLLAKISQPRANLPGTDEADVNKVVWAVRAASPYLRAVCLPQALATQVLLARRGFSSELRIGFTRATGGRMSAHAWVECQGRVAIGGTGNMAGYILVPLSEEMVRDGWCLFS
jgi:hypothetical protein